MPKGRRNIVQPGYSWCSSCKQEKLLSEFWKDKDTINGVYAFCKSCAKIYRRRYVREHSDKSYEWRIKADHQISWNEYQTMYANQNGLCAICKVPERNHTKRRTLNIDHNHQTGEIRGLLCTPCNGFLGRINDNPSSLLEYLKIKKGKVICGD